MASFGVRGEGEVRQEPLAAVWRAGQDGLQPWGRRPPGLRPSWARGVAVGYGLAAMPDRALPGFSSRLS